MPVTKCPNGKWRIGKGKCIYDTEEKAIEVYQAIIASGFMSADSTKVSVDYDGTLSTTMGKLLVKRLISEGKKVYIITRREQSNSGSVYKAADELLIPKSRVYFTNGQLKWQTIKRLNIGTHYDNNQNEIDQINNFTDARGIKF